MFLSNLKHNIFKFLFSPKVDVVGGDCDRDTHCVPPKICENGNSVLGIVQVQVLSLFMPLLLHYKYVYCIKFFTVYYFSIIWIELFSST